MKESRYSPDEVRQALNLRFVETELIGINNRLLALKEWIVNKSANTRLKNEEEILEQLREAAWTIEYQIRKVEEQLNYKQYGMGREKT